MTRLVAVAILPLALLLPGLGQAENWTEGTLSLSWDVPPPAYCDPDASFNCSATANYDPNLPEGTEWVWANPTYQFTWTFTGYGSGTWTSNYNSSSASGSFSDPENPGGAVFVEVGVNFTGEFIVESEGGGQTTWEVETGPAALQAVPVQPTVSITPPVGLERFFDGPTERVGVTSRGTAGPEGQEATVTVNEAWQLNPFDFDLPENVGPTTGGILPGAWLCATRTLAKAWQYKGAGTARFCWITVTATYITAEAKRREMVP